MITNTVFRINYKRESINTKDILDLYEFEYIPEINPEDTFGSYMRSNKMTLTERIEFLRDLLKNLDYQGNFTEFDRREIDNLKQNRAKLSVREISKIVKTLFNNF